VSVADNSRSSKIFECVKCGALFQAITSRVLRKCRCGGELRERATKPTHAAVPSRSEINRRYGIEPTDWNSTRGDWLLVAAGTGIMMSVMDQEPRFRWSIDTDLLLRTPEADRFAAWLYMWERFIAGRICAVGWYSRWQNGEPMAMWLSILEHRPLVYFGRNERPELWSHCDLAPTLDEFLRRLQAS
jgi:hypothetical protein